MQTKRIQKESLKNGLVRLNFSDTHQMKNYLNTLKIVNVDGIVKYTKLLTTDVISSILLSFFSRRLKFTKTTRRWH